MAGRQLIDHRAEGGAVGEQRRNVLEDDSRLRVVGDITDAFPDEVRESAAIRALQAAAAHVRHGTSRGASYPFPVWMHG
jgi:hypothetical protein